MSDRSTLTWPHSHRHPVRRAPEQMGAGKGRQAGHFCSGLSLRLAAAAAAHGNVHMVYSGIVRATDENLRRALGVGFKIPLENLLAGIGITALLQSIRNLPFDPRLGRVRSDEQRATRSNSCSFHSAGSPPARSTSSGPISSRSSIRRGRWNSGSAHCHSR
jgi:hypothetical protein